MWLYRRSGTSPQTIFQCSSLKIRWIDRTCSQPTAGGLCVLLLEIESATRRWGFASAQKDPGGAQQNLLRTTKLESEKSTPLSIS